MISTVIFDLDGTLLNTLDDIAYAMNRALRLHGLKEYPTENYKLMVGNGARKLAERAVAGQDDLLLPVLQDYQSWYETHNMVLTGPYAGVPEMLKELGKDGIQLSVLSNKPNADSIRVVREAYPDVDWTLIRGQMPGVPLKPSPMAVEQMLDAMCAMPGNTLEVGDSCVDVETAHNANLRCVGVSWGFRGRRELEQAGADFIIDRPEELPALIRSLN